MVPKTSAARTSSPTTRLLGVALRHPRWFQAVTTPVAPGLRTDRLLRIPQGDAQRLALAVVRRVADLPVGTSGQVVWTLAGAELLVHSTTVTLSCTTGLVTVSLRVECEQTGAAAITVPLAVGTEQRPAGLLMQAFSQVDGPPILSRLWSEALTAFAWELLVETARGVCGEVGRDTAGRPLIPGAIGAAPKLLLVQPMARHASGPRAARTAR